MFVISGDIIYSNPTKEKSMKRQGLDLMGFEPISCLTKRPYGNKLTLIYSSFISSATHGNGGTRKTTRFKSILPTHHDDDLL